MSYSRWSNSVWYTYWHCNDFAPDTKENQLFCIDCKLMLTYEECVAIPSWHTLRRKYFTDACTDEELQELFGYIQDFIRDMDCHEYTEFPVLPHSTFEHYHHMINNHTNLIILHPLGFFRLEHTYAKPT